MHKWQIFFEGKSDGEVIAFLKDVENMAIAQRTTVDDVRQGISTLLRGSARDWYRVCGYQLGTWTMFVSGLKEFFLPADFDHRVDAEIRATKQNEVETFQEFCIRMELVFMKLSYEMPEFMKVEHLKHNMHNSYKTADVARLKTINELRESCRYVDSINERFRTVKPRMEKPNFFRPQPKVFAVQNQSQENFTGNQSDDEENPSSVSQIATADENQRGIQEIQAISRDIRMRQHENRGLTLDLSQIKCYNCNEMGHYSNSCQRPRRIVKCSRCHAHGVTQSTCLNCRQWFDPKQAQNSENSPQSQ